MTTTLKTKIKVADEVWVATALLHREFPDRTDFSIDEIIDRARREVGEDALRTSVYGNIVQGCVANRPSSQGHYRMLFETGPGRRRLFRTGDSYDPGRERSKTIPRQEDIPAEYSILLDWYREWNQDNAQDRIKNDPLLSLYGSGRHIWADEDADAYIRRLREGWE